MSKQITIRDSQSISRDMLTTDENGNAVQIAMVSGDIRPGRGFSVTVHLTKPKQRRYSPNGLMISLKR